jgi:NADH-quinone oxidoreductase subunit N
VPIWVGFVAKFQVLKAAVDAGLLWLAITAGVFAVIGAYYYLRVIKVMYFDEPARSERLVLSNDMPFRFVLSVNGMALLALGVASGPLMAWCVEAVTR